MKIKHLKWELEGADYLTNLYEPDIGWITCIAFLRDGFWRLNYENKDPSEELFSASSFEELKQKAQEHHNKNVKADFF